MAKRKKQDGQPLPTGRPRSNAGQKTAAKRGVPASKANGRSAAGVGGRGQNPQSRAAQQAQNTNKPYGRVPPPEAFEHVKRLPPPSLPRREGTIPRGSVPPGTNDGRKSGAKAKQAQPTKMQRTKNRMPEPEPLDFPEEKLTPPQKPKRPKSPAKRRRNRRVAAVVAVAVLIVAGIWFSISVLFKIDKFVVEGESPYTAAEIEAVFGGKVGDTMYGFSAKNAAERIETALPYIEKVTIGRRLPGTVVFKVTMAEERYYLPQEGQFAVVSAGRKVLKLTQEEPVGLTRVEGLTGVFVMPGYPLTERDDVPEGVSLSQEGSTTPEAGSNASTGDNSAAGEEADGSVPDDSTSQSVEDAQTGKATRLETFAFLLDQLEAAGLGDVTLIDVSDDLDLRFCWQGRVTVILGAKSGIDKKLAAVAMLLTDPEQGIGEEQKGTLDASSYLVTHDVRFVAG